MRKKEDVFRRLAKHLDDLPAGFPVTKSGVELRILKRLFTEEQAEMALLLSVLPEPPESVAARARLSVEETARRLEDMAGRGLIYRLEDEDSGRRYSANQYVIGIWEYQVNSLRPDLVRDMEEYLPTLMSDGPWKKTPQLRTVPVMESLPVRRSSSPPRSGPPSARKRAWTAAHAWAAARWAPWPGRMGPGFGSTPADASAAACASRPAPAAA